MNWVKKSINVILTIACFSGFGGALWMAQAQSASQKKQLAASVKVAGLDQVIFQLKEEQKELERLSKYLPASFKKANKELVGFGPDQSPLFYEHMSVPTSAPLKPQSVSWTASVLQGKLLEGESMEIALWDQGLPRTSHQEFSGRLVEGEQSTNTNYSHATQVTSILLASGKQLAAKGVAPKARAKTYDWSQDRLEAAEEAAQGLLVSNHSYGISVGNLPQWYFGAYLKISQDWDAIQYNAPYYLSIVAAGNHAQGNDRLVGFNTSKNSLSVGSSLSATNTAVAPFSAYGPTDDGRIKPDLVAPGTQFYTANSPSDESYTSGSGTSFSTPVVSGAALIVQEAFEQTKGRFLKAASLKGVLMHTALDVGAKGPDYTRGWGVLQQDQAVAFIENLDGETQLIEDSLNHGAQKNYSFTAGMQGMTISLSWTDLPGAFVNSGSLNPTDPQLVHDLDIRLYKDGVTYMPFVLQPNNPLVIASTGDNRLDPFEQIQVSEPGEYELVVSHKGSLQASQDFSLLVSGIAPNPAAAQSTTPTGQTAGQTNTPLAGSALPNTLQTPSEMALENDPSIQLQAYPNPAMNELQVQGLESSSFSYYIYRSDGSIAGKGKTKNGKVAVNRLSNGFYILGIFHAKGYEAVKFFKR